MNKAGDDGIAKKPCATAAAPPLMARGDGDYFEPEMPAMRSVAMVERAALLSPVFMAKNSFEPLPKYSGLYTGVNKQPDQPLPLSVWTVDSKTLEMLPFGFALERTHREIHNADVTQISARVSNALRLLGVQADYDSETAKVKCVTTDMVRFRVRLYLADETGGAVIVEVQRRYGSASSFMRHCRAVLDAADGKPVLTSVKASAPYALAPVKHLKCLQSVYDSSNDEAEATAVLERICRMLRSPSKDQQLLALEELVFLSDPKMTINEIALRVSKCIALDEGIYGLREEIMHFIKLDAVMTLAIDKTALESQVFRNRAWAALANALSLCSQAGCLASAIEGQSWFSETLLPRLLGCSCRFEEVVNDSHFAASCLALLLLNSPAMRQRLLRDGWVEVLQQAYRYGEQCHSLLAKEVRGCLEVLETD